MNSYGQEVLPCLTQLQLAVEALPAERGITFLGLSGLVRMASKKS